MTQATYMQDMFGEPNDIGAGLSEVSSFYAERNVLITGGSGFLGKLLIEKILRSCSDIKTLFVLLRAKKDKSAPERFNELFDDVIFTRLKAEKPEFARKVAMIHGDMSQVGLGLSSENWTLLRSTHIVIHGAATVRFDEKLKTAISINVRGTKELLRLAKEMPDLKAFVHISTAYCNCVHMEIDEKFYPPPIPSDKLLDLSDILDDAALDHLTPVVLGKWPNTYTFTKAIAEDTVRRNDENLPLCIVRPSIVIATAEEPVPGWINNYYGATGIFIGAGLGLLRTLYCKEETLADLIPADYVVNTVITAAWDIAKSKNTNERMANGSKLPKIYNSVSSCQKPITWGEVCEYNAKQAIQYPSVRGLWYFNFKLNKHRWVHNISVIVLHLIPALIADTVARLVGKEPRLWAAYDKIHKFSTVIEYFVTRQWKFHDNNVVRLGQDLNATDRVKFHLDISELNWEDYCYHQVRGLRIYLLNDPLDTLPQALAKSAKFKVAHYTIIAAFWGFLFWLLVIFLRFIGLW